MNAPSIRKARASDLPAVADVLRRVHLGAEELDLHIENFFVAELGGMIIGTIGVEVYGTTGLIRSAAVIEEHQRKGIGNLLWEAAEEYSRECGITELILFTNTAESYFAARG